MTSTAKSQEKNQPGPFRAITQPAFDSLPQVCVVLGKPNCSWLRNSTLIRIEKDMYEWGICFWPWPNWVLFNQYRAPNSHLFSWLTKLGKRRVRGLYSVPPSVRQFFIVVLSQLEIWDLKREKTWTSSSFEWRKKIHENLVKSSTSKT